MDSTRATLARWNVAPSSVLPIWAALGLCIAITLLFATWVVSKSVTPDLSPVFIPGVSDGGGVADTLPILSRNALVLALHAMACVAGFIAGGAMPIAAAQRTGLSRWVHLRAGEFALLFVGLVTIFSLLTQALALGMQGSTIASQLQISNGLLVLSVLPHALPELTALFLPLAAWLIASRRGHWDQLLAATMVTVMVAIPVLVIAATLEVELWPRLLEYLSPVI